jgi:hypothetical protein
LSFEAIDGSGIALDTPGVAAARANAKKRNLGKGNVIRSLVCNA